MVPVSAVTMLGCRMRDAGYDLPLVVCTTRTSVNPFMLGTAAGDMYSFDAITNVMCMLLSSIEKATR